MGVNEYVWRVFNVGQMDFQFAYSQMADLLRSPAEVYKSTAIRKQIKNQWSRDDPAFLVLLVGLMAAASAAWLVAYGLYSVTHTLTIVVGSIVVLLFGAGLLLASAYRWYANSHMAVVRLHAIEQKVEWLYAFDVHCNAFFPAFVLLFALQFFLLPFLLTPHFLSTLAANTLYLAALAAYLYVTFLGYAALPFIERSERLMWPGSVAAVLYFCTLLLNVNLSYLCVNLYFGHTPEREIFVHPVHGVVDQKVVGAAVLTAVGRNITRMLSATGKL